MAKNSELFCPHLGYEEDSNADVAIVFCSHKENLEETEGNCRRDICPLLSEKEGHDPIDLPPSGDASVDLSDLKEIIVDSGDKKFRVTKRYISFTIDASGAKGLMQKDVGCWASWEDCEEIIEEEKAKEIRPENEGELWVSPNGTYWHTEFSELDNLIFVGIGKGDGNPHIYKCDGFVTKHWKRISSPFEDECIERIEIDGLYLASKITAPPHSHSVGGWNTLLYALRQVGVKLILESPKDKD